jgi:hypothetical protein
MVKTLDALGDCMLARLLPKTTAAACWDRDPYQECDYIDGVACAVYYGRATYFQCQTLCNGSIHCQQTGCC